MIRPILSIARNAASVRSVSTVPRVGLKGAGRFGIAITAMAGYYSVRQFSNPSQILNDATYQGQLGTNNIELRQQNEMGSSVTKKSHLSDMLNYDELTIGSVTGLFLGIIAGKMSSIIVFLTLSTYLLTQFLESRGIITIPWLAMITMGKEKMDIKELVFDKISFKIAFVSTFLIAAFNV